jgi:hypothetical protein
LVGRKPVSDVKEELVGAYESWFGPPVTLAQAGNDVAGGAIGIVHRRPVGKEIEDPVANATMLGTVGASAAKVVGQTPGELAFEVRGTLDESALDANAEALLDLASAPIRTGRPYVLHDLLSDLALPAFPGLDTALLVDWDPVDGFRFLPPFQGVGLLRVLPLHPSEVEHVMGFADRGDGYLSLLSHGMDEADPTRRPAV